MDNTINIQCELLGALMVNKNLLEPVQHLMRPQLFTSPITSKSYEIIIDYQSRNINPTDQIILNQLSKAGLKEGSNQIISKFHETPYLSPEQVSEYVEQLFNDYAAKYLSEEFKRVIGDFQRINTLEAMQRAKNALTNVELAYNNVSKDKSIKTQFKDAFQRIKGLKSGEIERTGFSWGIKSLDEKTLGIVQGINIVAADKGGGKSTLGINIIVENAVIKKLPLLFFSMEMTAVEVLTNVIANVKRINSKALRMGSVDEDQLIDIEKVGDMLNESLCIDETGGITWQYFEAKVRAHRKKNNIPQSQTILVMLDYLGLMKNSSDESRMSKEEKIEQICTELMRICKNENIALVKFAQFSRESSKRGNDPYLKTDADRLRAFRPRMSDLKGSAAIESNAVTIILLFRPEYYRIYEAEGRNFRGICEANIAKGRYVNPEPVLINFEGKYSRFSDIIEEDGGIKQGEGEF